VAVLCAIKYSKLFIRCYDNNNNKKTKKKRVRTRGIINKIIVKDTIKIKRKKQKYQQVVKFNEEGERERETETRELGVKVCVSSRESEKFIVL